MSTRPIFALIPMLVPLLAASGGPLTLRSSAADASVAPQGNGSFALRDVRVFDGERVIARANVIVRDGMIQTVGPDLAIPAGLAVTDGTGKTLLPGFLDAHTHSWGDAQRDALRFGVTTQFDMLGDWNRIPSLAAQRSSTAPTALADLWTAGAAVTAPGGHGTQFGMRVPTLPADADASTFVRARLAEGSDYVKIIVEDMSVYGAPTRMPTLSPAQVTAAIAATRSGGKLAVVHVAAQRDARHAVASGASGLVHIFQDEIADAAFVADAKRRDVFVIPTLSVIATMAGNGAGPALAADAALTPLLTPDQTAGLARTFGSLKQPAFLERALASVRALHQAGVTVLAGTDAPNPGTAHGVSIHGELLLLTEAGMTPAQALSAATARVADRFGVPDRGRIAPGKRADLILVTGDPTTDIRATRAIEAVWKNGYAIDRRLPAPVAATATGALIPADGLISDFDGERIEARFGAGWQPTTDAMMGGTSSVTHRLVRSGANGSPGALEVAGEIMANAAFPWAGVIFFPAAQPMQPADLSAHGELVFQAKGDGRTYQVMLFSGEAAQGAPAVQTFTAGPEWAQVRIPLTAFGGGNPALVRGLVFAAGQPAGAFRFQLDEVRLR
ncbi:MAG: CIA30 family protein [Gemmatimonadales bacterium]|nr:CIA30 family protein [Gemmatimonadales bacterium]